MEVVLSLTSALFYGTADFFGGAASRRASALVVSLFAQAAGVVLLLVVMPFVPGHASAASMAWGALAGICGAGGIGLLYHALSIGKMGLVSPVTAVIAAALPVLAATAFGERLSLMQGAGIFAALAAIVLIARSSGGASADAEAARRGLREAIVSGMLLAGFYLFLARAPREGGFTALLAARVAASSVLAGAAFLTKAPVRSARAVAAPIVLSGMLDVTANALYVMATYRGALAIAVVLTSLYPASTVALARVILGERLGMLQRIGVALAFAAVALIAWKR